MANVEISRVVRHCIDRFRPGHGLDVMNKQDEEVFLLNASLGTDLVTSYVAATGRPRRPSGCALLIVAVLVLLATLWLGLVLTRLPKSRLFPFRRPCIGLRGLIKLGDVKARPQRNPVALLEPHG